MFEDLMTYEESYYYFSEESEKLLQIQKKNRNDKITEQQPKKTEEHHQQLVELQENLEENQIMEDSDQLFKEVNQIKKLLIGFICFMFLWIAIRSLFILIEILMKLKKANKFSCKMFVISFFFPEQ
ncbi:hypothetical protein JTB14_030179 [Gonioctena quinquepunctata]|nr:hypothetical protein JTB14_030179 [Gonioctena quinquepunctata]